MYENLRFNCRLYFNFFQNHAEDTLRQELVTLQEEKLNYESTAKVSIQ